MKQVVDVEVLKAILNNEKCIHFMSDTMEVTLKQAGFNLGIEKTLQVIKNLANGAIGDDFIKHIMAKE